MKYKTLGIIACAAALLIGLVNWPGLPEGDTDKRIHQHREAQEKEGCMAHPDGELCTHLPLIRIDTGGVQIPGGGMVQNGQHIGFVTVPDGSDRITAAMQVMDSATRNNHFSDVPTVSSSIVIHARGNSSRYFDKLSYRLELVDENGENNPQSLMGMPAHHEWALHGPFLDMTLLRNYMWYNIAGECMEYAPNVRFCELVIDGEYQGVYVLTELIGAGKDGARLDLSVDAKDNTYSGYLLRLDRYDNSEYDWLKSLTTYTLQTSSLFSDVVLKLEVEYPGAAKLTPELKNAIKTDFSAFEKALYSYDYNSRKYGYANYIDVDSFIDYFLLNEFTANYDAGSYSTYLYKDTGGKLKMCVWDFNNSCDNYQERSMMQVQHFEMQNKLWFTMLTKDEDFTDRLIERYRQLRKTCLSEEYLLNYIDEVIDYLGPAIDRNYEKWGYAYGEGSTLLQPAERNLHSYEEAIVQLKDFILARGRWMDENIEALKQYSADSKVKQYNEVTD